MRYINIIVLSLLVSACIKPGTMPNASDDLNVVEYCYDGVVYIGEYSDSNLSVKFDNKGNVVTTTVDGKTCQ